MNTAVVVDLTPWREQCAAYATEAIYARYANELHRFGERGRNNCRQDMLFHLDYLQSALVANDSSIFTQYARWLNDVLRSRSVPTAHLSTSFDFLEAFFNNNIPAVPWRQFWVPHARLWYWNYPRSFMDKLFIQPIH